MLNELAWSVGTLALATLVYRRTGSAIGSTGFFLCSQVAPALVAPPIVARLDRHPPNRLLPALYGLEAILFGVLALLTRHFLLVPVLVLTIADGVVAIVARGLASAARTQLLRPLDLVPEGNAVQNTLFSVSYMVGPLLGGAVVVAGGTIAALFTNCGLFAVTAVLLATAGLPRFGSLEGPATGRLRKAIAHARADSGLTWLLVLQGLGVACFTISIPVEVIYAQHALHAGAGGYGALMSAWGGGAIAGSLAVARWRRSSTRWLIGGSSLMLAIGFGVMAVAPTLAIALVGSALAGIGNGIVGVTAQTAIQQRVAEQWLAVTLSLSESINQITPGAGILLGGVIAALASSRTAFGVGGAASLAFCLLAVAVLRPQRIGGHEPAARSQGVAPRDGTPSAAASAEG